MDLDYKKVGTLYVDPNAKYMMAERVKLNLGHLHDPDSTDDFFGDVTINIGDVINGNKVRAIAVKRESLPDRNVELLVNSNDVYYLRLSSNPILDDHNKLFSVLFWKNGGVLSRLDINAKDEIQTSPFYVLKNAYGTAQEDIAEIYANAFLDTNKTTVDTDLRRFIMEHVGNKDMSRSEAEGTVVFPEGIDEDWMRNRFLQTSLYLSEAFAFPDELTKDVFLCTFLTKGGSCLLSGTPGTGKTTLADLGTLLFFNSYGYNNTEYHPPIMDLIKGTTPKFIFKNLKTRKKEQNISTTLPSPVDIKDEEQQWVLLENKATTNKTWIDVGPKATSDIFVKRYEWDNSNDMKEIRKALENGLRMGVWRGPIKTQNYSRLRSDEEIATWEDERFDDHLMDEKGGVLKNQYYIKGLLRKGIRKIRNEDGETIDEVYVSDVVFDIARYPDTDKRVIWKEEVATEQRYNIIKPQIDELKKRLAQASTEDEKRDIQNKLTAIERDIKPSNIHTKASLVKDQWEDAYRSGRRGKLSETELEDMNLKYKKLKELLDYLMDSVEVEIFDARNKRDVIAEMKADMGLCTCSENKTPDEILYTTQITLVQEMDALGRPIQQYVFKPSPLDFVTKPGKFLNEFTRADKDFQDQLLSLLDRGLVEHRGEQFRSPDFVLFADNNPHKLLTCEIDWALWDRLDVELMLKGASLGTKDMVLSRRFGREDLLMGLTKNNANPEEELLERVRIAIDTLNGFKASAEFRKTGRLMPNADGVLGVIPLRVRDLHRIWKYVEKVTIPRNVLHYVILLTTTLNQAWYVKKTIINDSKDPSLNVSFPGTDMPGEKFQPYAKTLLGRETILDYSMLSFATDFMKFSTVVSNINIEEAKEQLPLGVTRPVGIRFVISLLKYAKSLAWLRRGRTEVTVDEINDLFPLVGSHRLNIMPFGEERIAGIDEVVKKIYPNIQDYLKYGVLESFWKKGNRWEGYLKYYEDLESIVNAGFLDVDSCLPWNISTVATNVPCKIMGNYTHNFDPSKNANDVVMLDIQNAVEFVKRNSPTYKRHYNRRVEQITNIGSKNYTPNAIKTAKEFIIKTDRNAMPQLLFQRDADALILKLSMYADIFSEDYHQVNISNQQVIDKVVMPVLERYLNEVDPTGVESIHRAKKKLGEISNIYETINLVSSSSDMTKISKEIHDVLTSVSQKDIESMTKDNILKALNKLIDSYNVSESAKLKASEYGMSGVLEVVFKSTTNDKYMRMKATTMNEHLIWEHIRFPSQSLRKLESLTEADKLS